MWNNFRWNLKMKQGEPGGWWQRCFDFQQVLGNHMPSWTTVCFERKVVASCEIRSVWSVSMCVRNGYNHFNRANCNVVAANEILVRGPARFHAGMQGYQLAARAVPAFHVHPGLWRDESIWTFTSVEEADESGASRVERLHPAAVRDKAFFAEGGHVFQLNLQPLISDLLQLSSSHLIITRIILSSKKHRRVREKSLFCICLFSCENELRHFKIRTPGNSTLRGLWRVFKEWLLPLLPTRTVLHRKWGKYK